MAKFKYTSYEAIYGLLCLDLKIFSKNRFSQIGHAALNYEKISFSRISSKLRTIGHNMLLHNSYTNMAIAFLLLYWKSPYGLWEPKDKFKIPTFPPKRHNWEWSPRVCAAGTDHPPAWFWSGLALATIIYRLRFMAFECYSTIWAWFEVKFIKILRCAKLRKSVFCEYIKN